ncbi:hypothetical protein [Mycobacterium sp. GA-2829]|uniref:hypothetical protein n=1 Tax=Mycobacterium sp. GA-2829 TaxID=1772283 RepID=UPI000AD79A68|nr:hypothetical protein [Mycobacterium sp. GA-2829]
MHDITPPARSGIGTALLARLKTAVPVNDADHVIYGLSEVVALTGCGQSTTNGT